MSFNRRRFLLNTWHSMAGAFFSGNGRLGWLPGSSISSSSLARDPLRPQYHLLSAANWMNDPDGPIYWKGMYHMFYQYNPNGAFWGDMHWAHAVSLDMVRWRHLPIALAPTPGGPDSAGCFSGSTVIHGDKLVVLYTGVVSAPANEATTGNDTQHWRESQCLAVNADEDLIRWNKDLLPVIAAPPPGLDVRGFRDPCLWRQGDIWYMALGAGIRRVGGAVLLYRSKDLRHWEYLHELFRGAINGTSPGSPIDSGTMWECPDFFPLGNKHVLIHSTRGKSFWQVGTFDAKDLVFHPETGGQLDYGSFYAPKTQLDRSQNRILWSWIPETRTLAEYKAAGWAGMMSLPRVLTLDQNNRLQFEVAPAVHTLRQNESTLRLTADEDINGQRIARTGIKGCCGQISIAFQSDREPVGFSLVSDGHRDSPWLACRYDPSAPAVISIDGQAIPVHLERGGKVELRFLIDGSVIESFVGKQAAYTKRFYYSDSFAPEIKVEIASKKTSILGLSFCQMSPISSNRLTT